MKPGGARGLSIADARRLCESRTIGDGPMPRGVIVLAFGPPGQPYAAVSYGATRRECRELGEVLDGIVELIGSGELPVWHSGEEDGTDYERPGPAIVDAPCAQHSDLSLSARGQPRGRAPLEPAGHASGKPPLKSR